jgi:hypothetical protein
VFRVSIVIIALLNATPAMAMDTIESKAATANATFPLIRCAGLYLWIAQAVGPEGVANGFDKSAQANAVFLLSKASDMRLDDGTDTFDAITSASREAQGFATEYTTRAEANDVPPGTAFGDDALVKADLSFCKKLGVDLSQSSSP